MTKSWLIVIIKGHSLRRSCLQPATKSCLQSECAPDTWTHSPLKPSCPESVPFCPSLSHPGLVPLAMHLSQLISPDS